MKHLTVRNVPEDLAAALKAGKDQLHLSLNQTVIELLRHSLGVDQDRCSGLSRLSGQWSEEEHERFQQAVAPFEEIDRELWG